MYMYYIYVYIYYYICVYILYISYMKPFFFSDGTYRYESKIHSKFDKSFQTLLTDPSSLCVVPDFA